MANKTIVSSASKKIGKAITLIKEASEEIGRAKQILEKYNDDRKEKDEEIEEIMLFLDDIIVDTDNLQKDMYSVGVKMGNDAYESVLEAEKFRVFCSLKDLYKDNGLPYYFVSYSKNLKESVASMYMSNPSELNKNAQQLVAVIITSVNNHFGTNFSSDTLQNIKTKDLVELLYNSKEKAKNKNE